jgi:uncharacterized membrane protein YdjX (TVP38/TMEM64 family)
MSPPPPTAATSEPIAAADDDSVVGPWIHRRARLWLGLLIGLTLLVAALIWAGPPLWQQLQSVLSIVVSRGNGWYMSAPASTQLGFVLLFSLLSTLAVPGGSVLAVAAGAVFGAGLGTFYITLSSTLGATLSFALARRIGRDRLRTRFPLWWHAVDEGVHRRGGRYLLALRLAPLIPYAVVNPLMGLTPMRTWTFFWISALGMAPGSAAYAFAGAGLALWALY